MYKGLLHINRLFKAQYATLDNLEAGNILVKTVQHKHFYCVVIFDVVLGEVLFSPTLASSSS